MFRQLAKSKRGVTFVELLISVMILGIASGAMLTSFVMGRYSVHAAEHRMEASNCAQAAMELLINDINATYVLPDGNIKNLGGSYSQTITNYTPGLKRVEVTITWTELARGSSVTLSEQFVTLVRE